MKNQKQHTIILLMLTTLLSLTSNLYAQDTKGKELSDPNIRMEKIKEKCKDLPLENRIRATVSRFNSTAVNAPRELGANMSTMLTSALQQVNCYNILLEKSKLDDINGEKNLGGSEGSDASTGFENDKMKIAQIIITGEITEYTDGKEESGGAFIVGVKKTKSNVHIGFVLNVLNPATREVLKATSFNVDGKASSGSSIKFLGMSTSSSSNSNPALANALEQGIIKSVEYLANEKDNMHLPTAEELNQTLTIITAENISFSQEDGLIEMLNKTAGVKEARDKGWGNNTAVISVKHSGSTRDLASALSKKASGSLEITGTSQGKISLRMK